MTKPVLYITPEAKLDLDSYISEAQVVETSKGKEVSGLLRIESKYESQLVVTKVYLLGNQSSGYEANLLNDGKDGMGALMEGIREDADSTEEASEIISQLQGHFHSHLGPVVWSGIDDDLADQYCSLLQPGEGQSRVAAEYIVMIVGNDDGEYRARLDMYFPMKYTIDDLPIRTVLAYEPDYMDGIRAELEEKVKPLKKTWKANKRANHQWEVHGAPTLPRYPETAIADIFKDHRKKNGDINWTEWWAWLSAEVDEEQGWEAAAKELSSGTKKGA